MSARASLRSQLLVGSLLWTLGVLLVVSMLLIVFLAHHPQPHTIVLGWMMSAPAAVTFAVGGICMAAGVWRIGSSLAAIDRIRVELARLHRGEGMQVDGRYPTEVQPLVADLNALLDAREQQVRRAVAKAADLAHGLKTPLAVLSRDAAHAARIDPSLSESMHAQVERMRRHIDYQLAHARAAAAASTPGVRAAIAPSVDALFRTLSRLHADKPLRLETSVPPDHAVRIQKEDFEEIVGNILDNACKWSRFHVRVQSSTDNDVVIVTVEDDGSGIDETMRAAVLQRGIRADQSVPGSGLGLAIARDLVELYGGSIELARSPLGGLRVVLRLPSAIPSG
jgi:signal transduction histidine kinase